jgi:hypothetical protein
MALLTKRPGFMEMTEEDKLLFYKYRYAVNKDGDYLVKFVFAVNWDREEEAGLAFAMMSGWKQPSVIDTLSLLSSAFSANKLFQHEVKGPLPVMAQVRKYAVARLERASNAELEAVLLQLIQAYRFEAQECPLNRLLVARALESSSIANHLYWYLSVESEKGKA